MNVSIQQISELANLLCERCTINNLPEDLTSQTAMIGILNGFFCQQDIHKAAPTTCAYVFAKGKNAGQACGAKNCKKHTGKAAEPKPTVSSPIVEEETRCTYVFAKGKNAGQACGAKNCKKHSGKSHTPQPEEEKKTNTAKEVQQAKQEEISTSDGADLPKQEDFSFQNSPPVQWCKENMKWWKNWRGIPAEFTQQEGCRMNRTTKIVINIDGNGQPRFVGYFNEGKFTPKHQVAPEIYAWCKASGLIMD